VGAQEIPFRDQRSTFRLGLSKTLERQGPRYTMGSRTLAVRAAKELKAIPVRIQLRCRRSLLVPPLNRRYGEKRTSSLLETGS
jgi:hypothetical protein